MSIILIPFIDCIVADLVILYSDRTLTSPTNAKHYERL